jgi:NAD(P)-dependent dehydrogenase (short-subunit alcohol dehydrogenase family)
MFSRKAQFIPCDVQNFDEQVSLFEGALQNSPNHSIDIVVANAGVIGTDTLCAPLNPGSSLVKPNLWILDINLNGTFYTAHIAMHYFHQSAATEDIGMQSDKCLILKSSLAGYMDQETMLQYSVSKNALRVLMRSLRRSAWRDGVRVNCVAPG